MSILSRPSLRLTSGGQGVDAEQVQEQTRRRRSRRLSLTNWRSTHAIDGSITHMDVFLGSITAVSELLVTSLVEKATRQGAVVGVPSLGKFNPNRLIGPNNPYRSPSRVVVFVLSTHLAGKPSPDAEGFLQWLELVSQPSYSAAVDPLQPGELHAPDVAAFIEPSAPGDNFPKDSSQSPRKTRIASTEPDAKSQSATPSAYALPSSFRIGWRRSFVRSNSPESTAPKLLSGLRYAVFGVGNSIYRTYNVTAKYVDSRLQELGAVRVCPLGLGDVSKNLDYTFAKWESQLLEQIADRPSSSSSKSAPATPREAASVSHRASLPSIISTARTSTGNDGWTN